MSINMSNVKAITLGGQNVKKIENSQGVVLWEATPAVVLDRITLLGSYKTKLPVGETFVFGGTVRAYYTDGNYANVTSSATFSGYNMSTAGTYTVTVSYTEGGITKTATYSLTVAATATATREFNILTSGTESSYSYIITQYYNRIVIPSKNALRTYCANYDSRDIYSVDTVKILNLYWCRQGYVSYQLRPFLLNGSTVSSTIIAEGYQRTMPSNASPMSFFSSSTTQVDITSYLNTSSSKSIYGAWAYTTDSSTITTPAYMFSSSTGSTTYHFCLNTAVSSLPSFRLSVTYTYFTS